MKTVLILFMTLFVYTPLIAEEGFNVSAELSKTEPGIAVEFKIPSGYYLYASSVEVVVDGSRVTALSMPDAELKKDPATGDDVYVYDRNFNAVYPVDERNAQHKIEIAYQGCSDEVCFLPERVEFEVGPDAYTRDSSAAGGNELSAGLLNGFRIAGTSSGYMKEADFLAFLGGIRDAPDPSAVLFSGRGIVVTLLSILLGGLALNLTPCVLPMIPVNLSVIGAGSALGSRARGFLLGGVYGAGIALVYGLLGAGVVLAGFTFGALNSSPWFNFAVAAVFLLLSLSMFGLFNIDLSRMQGRFRVDSRQRGRLIAAFLLGGLSALLSGACVAPVVISVLLFAADLYQAGNWTGLILPFLLGAGMALPWPFAGAGFAFLPRPGAWMVKIKYVFGLIIFIIACYYAFLGAALKLARTESGTEAAGSPEKPRIIDGWYTDVHAALNAARLTGRPVFVDFWAGWCKNCMLMEKTTFQSDTVRGKLDAFVKLKYRAENPRDPATRTVLNAFGVLGLPTYVVLVPE